VFWYFNISTLHWLSFSVFSHTLFNDAVLLALLLLTVMLEARVFSLKVSHEEEEINEAFSAF
jgi:hypothetical protein